MEVGMGSLMSVTEYGVGGSTTLMVVDEDAQVPHWPLLTVMV
jgi:hypothetical protein